MGCPTSVEIERNLTFSVCTHDPDTGLLADADAPPTYRLYEDETAAPILTGSMAKFDGAFTTGLYTEQIACTVANGFEAGKTYTIYITAAVAGSTDGIPFGFQVMADIADAVWDEAIVGHAGAGSTGARLTAAASAGDPWSTALPAAYAGNEAGAILSAIKDKTDDLGGVGAITWNYTVTDAVTGGPIDGVEIWVTTDSGGTNVVANDTTNTFGIVTFQLDAGTYYIWRKRAGYNFVNPDVETVV